MDGSGPVQIITDLGGPKTYGSYESGSSTLKYIVLQRIIGINLALVIISGTFFLTNMAFIQNALLKLRTVPEGRDTVPHSIAMINTSTIKNN